LDALGLASNAPIPALQLRDAEVRSFAGNGGAERVKFKSWREEAVLR